LGDNAKAGGFNAGGYDNSILNHLVLLGENTTDVDARIAIYQRIWGIVYQDLPILPIYYRTEIHAWNKMYTGFVLGIGNPINDGWGILKSQSLALVKIAVQSTTTTGPTTPVTDYTMLAVIVVVVIIVASLAYFAGRRGKRSA
jgi:ABC-type transport system substrate-binding protein